MCAANGGQDLGKDVESAVDKSRPPLEHRVFHHWLHHLNCLKSTPWALNPQLGGVPIATKDVFIQEAIKKAQEVYIHDACRRIPDFGNMGINRWTSRCMAS
jgi:hypothetical protein